MFVFRFIQADDFVYSRHVPIGDCVVENDSANPALNNTLVEEPKEKTSFTADFTYKGYPVNLVSMLIFAAPIRFILLARRFQRCEPTSQLSVNCGWPP